ncbi:glycoside hydrolase domain-containing protein [Dyella choica]|nr:glycoside hydrolase domain-containing protein [Dyella choica]
MTTAIAIPNGSIGFDHAGSRLSYNQARDYARKGYKFCIRYVPNPFSPGTTDLIQDEAEEILAAGLWLGAVQHCSIATETSSFVPTPDMGEEWGLLAAQASTHAGLATGTTVWLDLEGVKAGTPASDILGFCNRWFDQVSQAGFVSGIYVGFDCGLTSEQLYFQLSTKHYWRAPSATNVAYRGFQLLQHVLKDASGNELDVDHAQTDALGLNATVTSQ